MKMDLDIQETKEGIPSEDNLRNHADELCVRDVSSTLLQEEKSKKAISYKSMLMCVNGEGDNYSSEDKATWEDEDESGDEILEGNEQMDPLCPVIPITVEERTNLCRPWRRALIIKLLVGRLVIDTLLEDCPSCGILLGILN